MKDHDEDDVFGPEPLVDVASLSARYERLRGRYTQRDNRMSQVAAIREGNMSSVAPDLFPEAGPWQEPIIANMIDVAARDMAEMLAPLPSFNCTSPTMTDEKARERATLKTKVANGYVASSSLQVQAYTGADRYVTYGFLPARVEIDWEKRTPVIRMLDPVGSYPEFDRFGNVRAFFQRVLVDRDQLIAMFPEVAYKFRDTHGLYGSTKIEVVFYHDKDCDAAFALNGAESTLLDWEANPVGECLVRVAARPGSTDIPRGQFDDVIFVQLARARFALLSLQAAHEAVNAPIVVPTDVPDVPIGPGATIRTNNPQGVGRVRLDLPPVAFQEQAQLERELTMGARFPEVRTGNMDASVVTGRGVQALMGGYDSQVRAHQSVFSRFYQELVSLCLLVDETVFGGEKKTLRGVMNGATYEIEYDAAKAIRGDHTVEVKYGLMAGLDPNRWLVFALQARAEKAFSRDFMRREMPVDIDVEDEARKIDIEDMEEAAKQAIMGYAQSIPVLASNGQDPAGPIRALAAVIDGRRKGKPLADLIVEAFAPPEPSPEEMAAMEAQAAMAAGMAGGDPMAAGGGVPFGLGPTGLLKGVAPGQAGMAPGGRPDLNMMLAGLDARGNANLSASVSRRVAI